MGTAGTIGVATNEPLPRIWITREWGRNWIGCLHGMPSSGCNPTRICNECFLEALEVKSATKARAIACAVLNGDINGAITLAQKIQEEPPRHD